MPAPGVLVAFERERRNAAPPVAFDAVGLEQRRDVTRPGDLSAPRAGLAVLAPGVVIENHQHGGLHLSHRYPDSVVMSHTIHDISNLEVIVDVPHCWGGEVDAEVVGRRGRCREVAGHLQFRGVFVADGERGRRYAVYFNPRDYERQRMSRSRATIDSGATDPVSAVSYEIA